MHGQGRLICLTIERARKIGGVGSEDIGCPLQRTYSLALTRADLQTYKSSNFNSCSNRRSGSTNRADQRINNVVLRIRRVSQTKKFSEPNGRGLQQTRTTNIHLRGEKKTRGPSKEEDAGRSQRSTSRKEQSWFQVKELRDKLVPNRVL